MKSSIGIVFCLLFLLGGCADMFKYQPYARNVKKRPGKSGIIALKPVHRMEDQNLAQTMMAQNCGSKVATILEEGEVKVGTVTQGVKTSQASTKRSAGKFFGIPLTTGSGPSENTTSTTLEKKEWQITYKCK